MRCRRSSARADREEEGRGRRDDRTVRIIQRYAERFQGEAALADDVPWPHGGRSHQLRDHGLDQSGCDVVDETGHDHVAGHFLARAQRVDVERDRRSRVVDRSLV